MSYFIPIGGWVNFWGVGSLKFRGVVKKRQSPDFRSLEAGISANRHLVSSLGRAPVCQAGGHGFKPQPDQHSGSLNTCN